MKLFGKKSSFSPTYYAELNELKFLILHNWWYHGSKLFFDFSKNCKTSVSSMADDLARTTDKYHKKTVSLEKVINQFRYTLDLIDHFLSEK